MVVPLTAPPRGSTRLFGPLGRAEQTSWHNAARALAVISIVLTSMRLTLSQGLTVGVVVAVGLAPLWLTSLSQYRSAKWFLTLGGCAIVSGVVLTQLSKSDHQTSTSQLTSNSLLLVSLLAGLVVILWARTLLSDAAVAMWFGVGLLLGVSPSSTLFASNPWRFGFSVAITVIVLGAAAMTGRRSIELTAILVLTAISGLTDARSSFAILLLTAVLVAWQLRPNRPTRRGSAIRAVLGIAAIGFVVYNVGQALILDGYLGETTQERSVAQLDASGSLILGGRPELAATGALMQASPWGFGSGVKASLSDILVAKSGMIAINYQPDNGYVERYMFGSGYELHSSTGDLWANFGILGIALVIAMLFLTLRGMGLGIASNSASAIVIYLAVKTLWNLAFAPFFSSLPLMILLLGLVMIKRSDSAEPGSAVEVVPAPELRR